MKTLRYVLAFGLVSSLIHTTHVELINTEFEKQGIKEESITQAAVSRFDIILRESFKIPVEQMTEKELFALKWRIAQQYTEGLLARIATTIRYIGRVLQDNSYAICPFDKGRALEELLKIQPFFEHCLAQEISLLSKERGIKNIDEKILVFVERTLLLSDQVINYLSTSIKDDFKTEKPFNLFIQNINDKESFRDFSKEYAEDINKKVEAFEKQTKLIGLSTKNKTARFLMDQVISPLEQAHYYFPVGKILSLSLIAGTYYLWKSKKELPLLGKYPQYITKLSEKSNGYTEELNNSADLRICGILVDAYTNLMKDGITQQITTALIGSGLVFYGNIKNSIQQWWQQYLNKARGGVYGELSIQGLFNFEPRRTLDDVVGYDDIKTKMEEIVECMANPEQFMTASKKRSMRYLFAGVSRSGKTYMAEALCGSIKRRNPRCNLLVVEYQHIVQMGIKNIFAMAKIKAPMILFFDEAHLLRLQEKGNEELLKEFLTVMGGQEDFDPSKPVVVIMATTHPEHMDTALQKRFESIHFALPTLEERKIFIIRELQQNLLNPNDFAVQEIAEKSEGLTFSDLGMLFSHASIQAWFRKQLLSQSLLDSIFNEVLRKIVPNSHSEIANPQISREIATYIASQAIFTSMLNTDKPLDTCTINKIATEIKEEFSVGHKKELIDPNSQYGAIFRRSKQEDRGTRSMIDIENDIRILLAGRAGLKLIFGFDNHGIHKEDDKKAYDLLKKWHTPSIPFEGSDMKNKIEQDTYAQYMKYSQETYDMLVPHKARISLLADTLQLYGTLHGEYVEWLLTITQQQKNLSENDRATLVQNGPHIMNKMMQEANTQNALSAS